MHQSKWFNLQLWNMLDDRKHDAKSFKLSSLKHTNRWWNNQFNLHPCKQGYPSNISKWRSLQYLKQCLERHGVMKNELCRWPSVTSLSSSHVTQVKSPGAENKTTKPKVNLIRFHYLWFSIIHYHSKEQYVFFSSHPHMAHKKIGTTKIQQGHPTHPILL